MFRTCWRHRDGGINTLGVRCDTISVRKSLILPNNAVVFTLSYLGIWMMVRQTVKVSGVGRVLVLHRHSTSVWAVLMPSPLLLKVQHQEWLEVFCSVTYRSSIFYREGQSLLSHYCHSVVQGTVGGCSQLVWASKAKQDRPEKVSLHGFKALERLTKGISRFWCCSPHLSWSCQVVKATPTVLVVFKSTLWMREWLCDGNLTLQHHLGQHHFKMFGPPIQDAALVHLICSVL